jgi:hypothetical protein
MTDDFFNSTPPAAKPPTTTVSTPTLINTSTNFQLPDLTNIISTINTFALAWTIFYSAIMLYNFYFYRVANPGGEVERETKGVQSFKNAISLWFSYATGLVLFIIYESIKSSSFGFIFGLVVIVYFFLKLTLLDLPLIPVIDKYTKNVSSWLAAPFVFVSSLLTPKKEAPIPTKKK